MSEIKLFDDLKRETPELRIEKRHTFKWVVKSPIVLCGFAVELAEGSGLLPASAPALSSYAPFPEFVSETARKLWTLAAVEFLYIGRIVAFKVEVSSQWCPLAFVLDFPGQVVPPGIEMRLGIVSNTHNALKIQVTPKGYLYEGSAPP